MTESNPKTSGSPAAPKLPGSGKPRGPKANIYLSWGGETYGPATPEEVANGIRTSWFEEDTVYWHEGLEEWKPVNQFPVASGTKTGEVRPLTKSRTSPPAPEIPPANLATTAGTRKKSRRGRSPKSPSRRRGLEGRAMFLVFALLAVLLTVGILLLLTLV